MKWNSLKNKIVWHYQNKWYPVLYSILPHRMGINPDDEHKVIISLTSIPSRIPRLHYVIERLLRQTVKPWKVILYLKEEENLNENSLPANLKELCRYGLTIKWVENLNCHTKYYFSVMDYPDAVVITVDDDGWYSTRLVEYLMASYKRNPMCISAMHIHKVKYGADGNILPYNNWVKDYNESDATIPNKDFFATGWGGVLYPPNLIKRDLLLDRDSIKKYCLRADDVWLYTMEYLSGIKVVKATDKNISVWSLSNSQTVSLHSHNVYLNRNDEYIQNMKRVYGVFEK